MAAGAEVVEDCGNVGLTPEEPAGRVPRADLTRRRMVTCAEAQRLRDRRRVEVADRVLVRQRPGSAKGVMFITIEVVWTSVFEAHRRIVLGAGMIAVQGRIQREGEVVHLVVERLTDLSSNLASVGSRDAAFPLPHGRGDEFHHGSPSRDPRDGPPRPRPRDISIPDLRIDAIRITPRYFR